MLVFAVMKKFNVIRLVINLPGHGLKSIFRLVSKKEQIFTTVAKIRVLVVKQSGLC